jgi:tetratricopeptide (TPR) repeat protein
MARVVLSSLLALLTVVPAVRADTETSSPRSLFEAGKYEQVLEIVMGQGEGAAPGDLYVAAQSLTRLDRRDEARDVYRRLDKGNEDDAWTFIGRSAAAAIEGNMDAASESARRAVELAPDGFHAHYQLGLVQSLRDDYAGASASFDRATQIDGNDAYAHYYAGLAYNKIRRMDLMARHFKTFLSLAPEAPERGQVQTILKTLRF